VYHARMYLRRPISQGWYADPATRQVLTERAAATIHVSSVPADAMTAGSRIMAADPPSPKRRGFVGVGGVVVWKGGGSSGRSSGQALNAYCEMGAQDGRWLAR
jgi:N-acyl-D-aspartate/D-glutamate deacylase